MMIVDLITEPHWFFLCLGGILLAVELLGAGGYALWSGFAALVVGILAWIFPSLSWYVMWIIFSVMTLIIAYLWWKWGGSKKTEIEEKDAHLNERSKQLIGKHCLVIQDFQFGIGRVQIGDSSWTAKSSADLPSGTHVKVIDIDNITLIVEPL